MKIGLEYEGKLDGPLPEKLRFYIVADALLRNKIFAAIFSTEQQVLLAQKNEGSEKFDKFAFLSQILPIGLEENESLFPYPPTIHRGFRMLQEYFAFPDKFFGFDIIFPENTRLQNENVLYIPLGHSVSMHVNARNFSLSAVPAICDKFISESY